MRSRINYANLMSTVAVFVALGGSSFAAVTLSKGQVKTKHIANSAVTSAKVKNGSLLSKDFKAGQLPAGPQGRTGPAGPKGDTGARGPAGTNGTNGTDGEDFTVQSTLAPGQTLTGIYAMTSHGAYGWGSADFRIPLAAPLDEAHQQVFDTGEGFTAPCPGPGQAAPGYLCVYERSESGIDLVQAFRPETGGAGVSRTGFGIYGDASSAPTWSYGEWAVTAPTSAARQAGSGGGTPTP